MYMDNNSGPRRSFGGDNRGPREMVKGNWTCKGCSKEITELPFQPRDPDNVLCRDCHMQNRPARSNDRFGGGGDRPQRQMVQGDWTCGDCGNKITELPFEPSGDRPILCRDCHSKQRQSRPSFGGGNRY